MKYPEDIIIFSNIEPDAEDFNIQTDKSFIYILNRENEIIEEDFSCYYNESGTITGYDNKNTYLIHFTCEKEFSSGLFKEKEYKFYLNKVSDYINNLRDNPRFEFTKPPQETAYKERYLSCGNWFSNNFIVKFTLASQSSRQPKYKMMITISVEMATQEGLEPST